MKDFAAYFWMISSFVNMFIIGALAFKTKKTYHCLYFVMWFSCGMWGMTGAATNIEWVRILNSIILPIIGGTCGMIGASMKLAEILHENRKK